MVHVLMEVGLVVLIVAMVCTQLFLLFKYFAVRRIVRRMEETSSGDHVRYKRKNETGK